MLDLLLLAYALDPVGCGQGYQVHGTWGPLRQGLSRRPWCCTVFTMLGMQAWVWLTSTELPAALSLAWPQSLPFAHSKSDFSPHVQVPLCWPANSTLLGGIEWLSNFPHWALAGLPTAPSPNHPPSRHVWCSRASLYQAASQSNYTGVMLASFHSTTLSILYCYLQSEQSLVITQRICSKTTLDIFLQV